MPLSKRSFRALSKVLYTLFCESVAEGEAGQVFAQQLLERCVGSKALNVEEPNPAHSLIY